ncbi:MAG: sugar phosphate nucleotidyltransferase [Nitrospiria bacterium]
MIKAAHSPVRCGIVLAAGEGKRVRPFIHRVRGESLPKQYVNFIGTRSMLEHTFHRAEKLIPPDRLFTVVSLDHLEYPEAGRQLMDRPKGTVILQPENKETAPGLLLPLMHLYKRYPESVVVIFPSDHFIVEEDLFMGHVDLACRIVERDPSCLLLLGIDPYGPETEYGYIVPGRYAKHAAVPSVREVLEFVEKPRIDLAHRLVQMEGLWNTMVMVFRAETLLNLAIKILPSLTLPFKRILEAIGSAREMEVVQEIYQHLQPVNFSSGLLEDLPTRFPAHINVLPVREVFWSDWGSEQRIVEDLRRTGHLGPTEYIPKEMHRLAESVPN